MCFDIALSSVKINYIHANCFVKIMNDSNTEICSEFKIKNISAKENKIIGNLIIGQKECNYSYMDSVLSNYRTDLALYLREVTGKNQYFDIRNGIIILFIYRNL